MYGIHTRPSASRRSMSQRRAACFCINRDHNTFNVDKMMNVLQWPTLQQRRKQTRLTMLYKMTNSLAHMTCNNLSQQTSRGRRAHNKTFRRITCRTDYRNYSFLPCTNRDWNGLASDTVQSPSLGAFKTRVM